MTSMNNSYIIPNTLIVLRDIRLGFQMTNFDLMLLLLVMFISTASSFSTLPVIQLWLDLSGTAIQFSPALVRDSLPPGTSPDKVILSYKAQAKLDQFTKISDSPFESELNEESMILYQTKLLGHDSIKTFMLFENASNPVIREDCSYGYILSANDFLKESVIDTVDTITSGKWVVLDMEKNVKKSLISDYVNLIVPFILAQSNLPGVLGGATSNKNGGLGLKCKTKADVVTWGSLLQSSISLSDVSLETTNEGVIWRPDKPTHRTIAFALVLPFDYEIWEAGVMLRRN